MVEPPLCKTSVTQSLWGEMRPGFPELLVPVRAAKIVLRGVSSCTCGKAGWVSVPRIRCVGVGNAGCAITAAAGVDGAAEDAGGGVTGLRRSIFCNNLRIWGTEGCAD